MFASVCGVKKAARGLSISHRGEKEHGCIVRIHLDDRDMAVQRALCTVRPVKMFLRPPDCVHKNLALPL